MQAIQSWSFAKVPLVSSAWVLLCVLIAVAWLLVRLGIFSSGSSGSGGIGVVSFGISELVIAIPVLPPVILIVVWLVARWR